jgi:hypothetical protein
VVTSAPQAGSAETERIGTEDDLVACGLASALQPYLGVGPGLFIVSIDDSENPRRQAWAENHPTVQHARHCTGQRSRRTYFPCRPNHVTQSFSLLNPWVGYFAHPPATQSLRVAGAGSGGVVAGLADGAPGLVGGNGGVVAVPGVRGTTGVSGRVSPGTGGPRLGRGGGLGTLGAGGGAVGLPAGPPVWASAGAALAMRARAPVNTIRHEVIW